MSKKRKLNSNNPKYKKVENSNVLVIEDRRFMCNAKVRDIKGDVVKGVTIPVHSVWYKD